jgi:hypothetical protein
MIEKVSHNLVRYDYCKDFPLLLKQSSNVNQIIN